MNNRWLCRKPANCPSAKQVNVTRVLQPDQELSGWSSGKKKGDRYGVVFGIMVQLGPNLEKSHGAGI